MKRQIFPQHRWNERELDPKNLAIGKKDVKSGDLVT